ncbi:phage portal protein [Pseudomonas nitroreducens]|nr:MULTISPECIES: phage portal protein [Pseudomonas]MCE4073538.1 phage portal protein [Pseudomonas nitritireducens]MCE4079777.1 phage portal protein [Pseudomonas nitroreducens]
MKEFPRRALAGSRLPGRIKNSYDGAGTGRRAKNWDAPPGSINTLSLPALPMLRKRSRAAVSNDPYAGGAIDARVSNLIGTGITPMPTTRDKELRRALLDLWADWTDESDADERTDFYGQQALASRMVEESGECFVRLRPRRLEDGLAVPLQVQLLPAEFVPVEKNETTRNGNLIRAGIEFNALGKRVAYWMYRRHPGDSTVTGAGYNQLVRVPASEVLHIYELREAGQLRGVPRLSRVLLRLRSLDNFDDAVLFRQEVSNLFAGFITRPSPSDMPQIDPINGGPAQLDTDGFTPMVGLEPGTMQELLPGEKVEFSKPPEAGNNYPDFMRQQLQASAVGASVPYELMTGDLRQVNDRVIRVVLNEFRRRLEQLQFSVYVHQFCRPIRAAWLDMAYLSGAIDLPDFARRRREYLRTRWVPQGWAYIHPVQDIQGKLMEINGGVTSRSEVVLRNGYDAETIDEENAADQARARSFGLSYTTGGEAPLKDDEGETP